MQELQVKPEMEAFEMGHLWFANQLYKEELIDSPPLYQICLGIPWGSPATTAAMKVMADMIPSEANWAGFGIGRHQMSMRSVFTQPPRQPRCMGFKSVRNHCVDCTTGGISRKFV